MEGASGSGGSRRVAVVGFDVGNSKTDVALVAADGECLGAARGPSASHQHAGTDVLGAISAIAARAASGAGLAHPFPAEVVSYCAAGADYPSDVALLRRVVRRSGLGNSELVLNDTFAGLRAGTPRTWGVCVVCGSGTNCVGVAPDGRVARFDGLGGMSGDWGGGRDISFAGIGAAVRAEDGRGPETLLRRTIPEHFGVRSARALVVALYHGTIPYARHHESVPLVFAAATAGDSVARAIVDRVADEVVAFAAAAIRRLRLTRRDPHVVLSGGVFRTSDGAFFSRIDEGLAAVAPGARAVRLEVAPVVGSALLGLDRLHGGTTPPEVEARLRAGLEPARFAREGDRPIR